MKKVNAILDELTIINSPFFFRLLKRYYFLTIMVPLFITAFGTHYYFSQQTVFIQEAKFSLIKDDNKSASKSLANLMGEKSGELNSVDILQMVESSDFNERVANILLKMKDINQFVLVPINDRSIIRMENLLSSCSENEQCKTEVVASRIPGHFEIVAHTEYDHLLSLRVKTLDLATTKNLLIALTEAIIEKRRDTLKSMITQQLSLTDRLLDERTSEVGQVSIDQIKSSIDSIRSDIALIDIKIQNLELIHQRQNIQQELVQSKYEEAKKILNTNKITGQDISLASKYKLLLKETDDLRQDIQALEISQEKLSSTDVSILNQLKTDFNMKIEELKKVKEMALSLGSIEKLDNTKGISKKDIESEYSIGNKQISKTSQTLKEMKEQRGIYVSELKSLEMKEKKLAPLFEYIKILKNKRLQLEILQSTVTPDVLFDNRPGPAGQFKRTSIPQVVVYSSFLAFFLLFLTVLFRYVIDPRVYDEYELRKSLSHIAILGKVPGFHESQA